jgi:hypothetical protein
VTQLKNLFQGDNSNPTVAHETHEFTVWQNAAFLKVNNATAVAYSTALWFNWCKKHGTNKRSLIFRGIHVTVFITYGFPKSEAFVMLLVKFLI